MKISSKRVVAAGVAVSLAAALYFFGVTGGRTFIAMAVFFFLPFYMILQRFDFEQDERVFFAFFVGIGIFSVIIFYVGRIVPSFRFSAAISFVALVLLSFVAKKFMKK